MMKELLLSSTANAVLVCSCLGLLIYRIFCLSKKRKRSILMKAPLTTFIIFGSGGHTTEMLQLLKQLDGSLFSPLVFVLSNTDKTSEQKILSSKFDHIDPTIAMWIRIQRSREVKQGWLSTIGTAIIALAQSVYITLADMPDLIICNGPGTCVPICVVAFALKVFGIHDCTIVFAESFCRVHSLSLTGKLLYPICDSFIVQWPQLLNRYPNAKYLGKIC